MQSSEVGPTGSIRVTLAIAVFGTILIYALLLSVHGPHVLAGNVSNSDDMMRMLQVRDLLGGGPWFNVDQTRLLTPEGGDMHWSRIPDLLIGGLELAASPFTDQAGAEIFAALTYPGLVLLALTILLLILVRRAGGGLAAQIFALVAISGLAPIYQFWPGRVDHHALNAVLVVAAFAALTVERRRVAWSALAGILCAMMVSVAAETLPMSIALIGGAGLIWVIRGPSDNARLTVFGATLSAAAVAFVALDAPGWDDQRAVCDALGWSHLTAFLLAGAAFVTLGFCGRWLKTWPVRLGAGLLAGMLVACLIVILAPDCLGSPYAGVSDRVRDGWLSIVSEAQTLPQKFSNSPAVAVYYMAVPILGALCLGVLLKVSPPKRREHLVIIAFMLALSLIVTVWQVRAMIFAQAIAVIPLSLAVGMAFAKWQRVRGVGPLLIAASAAFLLSPQFWRSAPARLFPGEPPVEIEGLDNAMLAQSAVMRQRACQTRENYATIATWPAARIFTPIDLGASTLYYSPHSVFTAPYHRNLGGIDNALQVWTGTPEAAKAVLDRVDADMLMFCPILPETRKHSKSLPDSLSAALQTGNTPSWLEPVETGSRLQVYRIRH